MLIQYKFILWMFGLILLIGLLFGSRLFSFMDENSQVNRVKHLDGLRFFLAFIVALHHYLLCYFYFHGQAWSDEINRPNYPIVMNIGGLGVAIFFMISGYLFACTQPTSWIMFYQKRFFSHCTCFLSFIYILHYFCFFYPEK